MSPRVLLLASAAVFAAASPAVADRMAAPPPLERALAAPVVVVGKVASFEADTVDAEPFPGAPQKVAHKVAIVKIETALAGAKGLTHVKIGFVPKVQGKYREDFHMLKDGQAGCFFLTKHPTADFYTFNYMSQPLNADAPNYKDEVAKMTTALGAVGDPLTALKAEKATDRYLAAVALVTKYQRPHQGGVATEPGEMVAVPAAERKLIYAALLAADWKKPDPTVPAPAQVVGRLISRDAGGFLPPPFPANDDYPSFLKACFEKWVAGDGAKFELKKFVPKAK